MKRFFLSVFVIYFSIYCTAQSIKVQDSKDKRIIDLDQASYPDTSFLHSTLYKSVKIIPLETKKSCLIGAIDQIQVVDNYILIMDAVIANSLYVFDREGHFIRKIGGVGQGPGEYVSIFDFTIDRENKTVYILDGRWPRILKYDLATGKFIQKIEFERNESGAHMNRFVHIGGNLYATATFYDHSPDNFLLYTLDESSGKEKNNFLNVMEYNKGYSDVSGNNTPDRPFYSRDNGDAIFVRPMMNEIIEITKDGVFSLFELKGKNLLASSDAKKLCDSYNIQYVIKNRGNPDRLSFLQINKYTHFISYVEKGAWILIDRGIGMSIHEIVINKKTNEVCVYKGGSDDLLYSVHERSSSFVFGCTDSNGVYKHTSTSRSNGVSDLQDYLKKGALSPDVIGLEKIKDLKDDDNPILIYYEFKE